MNKLEFVYIRPKTIYYKVAKEGGFWVLQSKTDLENSWSTYVASNQTSDRNKAYVAQVFYNKIVEQQQPVQLIDNFNFSVAPKRGTLGSMRIGFGTNVKNEKIQENLLIDPSWLDLNDLDKAGFPKISQCKKDEFAAFAKEKFGHNGKILWHIVNFFNPQDKKHLFNEYIAILDDVDERKFKCDDLSITYK